MFQTAPTLIAALLSIVSIALVWSHLRARRQGSSIAHDDRERRYRARQFRRRMWTSVMVGLLGAALIVGQFFSAQERPLAYLAFWSSVVLATLWIGLSAVVDLLSTRQYTAGRRRERQAEIARLEGQLSTHVQRNRNGNPRAQE